MSATDTDTTGTAGEDRFLRLLDDEGSRWRAGYQPPSFDDAVRRLALPGDEGARLDDPHEVPGAAARSGWWRPALIAAAVLVLVGGVVGVVRAGVPRPVPSGDARTSMPRLAAPPAGFHVVDGAQAAGELGSTAPPTPASSSETTKVTYVGPRELSSGGNETMVVSVTPGPPSPLVLGQGPLALVQGHVATVRTGACGTDTSCLVVDVSWVGDGGETVTLSYAGPNAGLSGSLGFEEILAAAESFHDGTATTAAATAPVPSGEEVLPRRIEVDGRTLVLWTTDSLRGAAVNAGPGEPTAVVAMTPAWPQGEVTYCDPVDVPVLTAQDARHVQITIGRYVTTLPTQLHPCPARPRSTPPSATPFGVRSVVLDAPLDGRAIVDGVTGKTVSPIYLG